MYLSYTQTHNVVMYRCYFTFFHSWNSICSGVKRSSPASKKTPKNLDPELKEPAENGKELSRKDPSEKNSIEQRVILQPSPCLYCCLFLKCIFYLFSIIQREYFEREMEKRPISRSPLGKDRDYNRYWWFRRDGRIFVESCDSKEWGYYSSKEEVLDEDSLLCLHFVYIF
jgi:hypothetical protein